MDLLELYEAKQVLNYAEAVVTHDEEIERFIGAVSGRIDDLCGPVVARTVTELHDGGCEVIYPRKTPVYEVTSVVEYDRTTSTALTAGSNVVQPQDAFYLDDEGTHTVSVRRGRSGSSASFPSGRRNVELVYLAGRVAGIADVPDKFKLAAALCLQHLWRPASASWAQSSSFVDTNDSAGTSSVAPWAVPRAVTELLGSELLPPGMA